MKIIVGILGVIIAIVGITWFLQGINVLPGSFMTGQTQWAIYGVITFAIGAAMALYGRRPPKK